jgi:hypothetical protein
MLAASSASRRHRRGPRAGTEVGPRAVVSLKVFLDFPVQISGLIGVRARQSEPRREIGSPSVHARVARVFRAPADDAGPGTSPRSGAAKPTRFPVWNTPPRACRLFQRPEPAEVRAGERRRRQRHNALPATTA